MKYINQLEHRDILYEHNLDHGGVPEEKRNVAAAGCGPSCLCMMVDALTLSTYELTDCLKLSNEVGANREIGTSLKILGPVVAERFNLNYGETSDLNELKAHLAKGGLAIANSGGDREGYTGVFTHGGHYILVVSADDNEACIQAMLEQQQNMRIPTELIPHCPKCGKPMAMNLRADDTFVQDEGWYRAAERYEDFLRRYENLHILFLELGVGHNTPAIIKYPFWQMTAKNPRAVYACVNFGEALCPEQIRSQAICIDADIHTILEQ